VRDLTSSVTVLETVSLNRKPENGAWNHFYIKFQCIYEFQTNGWSRRLFQRMLKGT